MLFNQLFNANSKKPLRILSVALLLTAILIALMSWKIYQSERFEKSQLARRLLAESLRYQLTYQNERLTSELRLASLTQKPSNNYTLRLQQLQSVLAKAKHYADTYNLTTNYENLLNAYNQLVNVEAYAVEKMQQGNYLAAQEILFSENYSQNLAHYIQATYQFISVSDLNLYWLELCNNLFTYQEKQSDALRMATIKHDHYFLETYNDYYQRIKTLFKEMAVNGEQVISLQQSSSLERAYDALDKQDRKVIALVSQQDYKRAYAITNTKSYIIARDALDKKLQAIHNHIHQLTLQDLRSQDVNIYLTVSQIFFILLLFLLICVFVLRAISYWQKELLARNRQLSEINDNLDLKVIQRTQRLQQAFDALQKETEAKEQLAEALQQNQKLQAVGTLAAGIAHDFNNLLAVILSHGEFMKRQLTNPELVNALTKIITTTDKASHLTQQLLTFARQGAHHKIALDVNNNIEHAIDIIQPTIKKDITIVTHLAADVPALTADKNQFLQVLINLMLNADDAMGNGGTLTITSELTDIVTQDQHIPKIPTGEYITISIADTGCGIADDVLSLIFDPFYTTKEVGKGTGLGLASVYGIMQQHNGYIEVESEPEQGTNFILFFPLNGSTTAT